MMAGSSHTAVLMDTEKKWDFDDEKSSEEARGRHPSARRAF
jgi:hypothetical protein